MPYSSNTRTPYVGGLVPISVFRFCSVHLLTHGASGFRSNSIYQPLFEHWVHVWQGPRFIQKILENFAVCGTLDILSDLCEVRFGVFLSLVLKEKTSQQTLCTFVEFLRRNNVGNAQRDDVRKSYEFTLNHVGQDKDSGEIWSDYIQFLQSGEVCQLVPIPCIYYPTYLNCPLNRQRHRKNNRRWMPSVKFTIELFKFL